MFNKSDIEKYGYLNLKADKSIHLPKAIKQLCEDKNAVIFAHYYQTGDIQDIAHFVGDSLALAQQAARTKADIILLCGVHFMAETAKILCPDKKVLLPDTKAGCSLADSCNPVEFKKFREAHPDYTVISYVNTSAAIKALTDIVCTSTNALAIVNSLPAGEKIIFAPDRNLGSYIKSQTGREMLIWDGACHVHEEFSLERILAIKKDHPQATIIAHPECKKPILLVSDFIGSTAALLSFVKKDSAQSYIVATESGILHQMKKACPDKEFIAAPPIDSSCGCNDCTFMKLNTLEKIYHALKYELPEVLVEESIRTQAVKPINRMLEISEKLSL
ncbi:MAG: quinolinate synthase NadA [Bacteroidota bacterium]|nr:MAG: quinolinate synthase NadA [Bacteroidota bacterium]